MSDRSVHAVSLRLRHQPIIISFLVVLLLMAGVFWDCHSATGQDRVHVLQSVDDPLVLPYRFEAEYKHSGPKPTELIPLDFDGDGELESYQVQIGRHPMGRFSSVLFYECVSCGIVKEQYNYENALITDQGEFDLDGDGLPEVVVLFTTPDTLYAEILDPETGPIVRIAVSTGPDRNGDGIWDAYGYILGCDDLSGDGIPDLLVSVDVAYDYYTRELVCLDWTTGRLWDFEVSGNVTFDRVLVTHDSETREKRIIFGVCSKGNAVVANGMDDQHSYLICLDAAGGLVWRRETGGVFTNPSPAWIRYDDDSIPDIVFESSYFTDSTTSSDSTVTVGHWSLVVCDVAGVTVDSLPVVGDHRLRAMAVFGDGLDREPCIAFELNDDTVRFYDEYLKPKLRLSYPTRITPQGFYDFLGSGEPQFLIWTNDLKLWLLDYDLEPLAQITERISPTRVAIFTTGFADGAPRLVVTANERRDNYVFRIVSTPWYTIFYRHPLMATAAGVMPLLAILSVVGVAMVRGRRKNRIISRQKNELEQALNDLHVAKDKLIEAEKSQLTHDIAGGVAHEIRNALDPAVQCLNALQAEPPASDERLSAMLDLSRRSVTRAIQMTRMVKELSDLSGTVGSEVVAVREVIDDILVRNQERIGAVKIDVDVRVPEGLMTVCTRDHADILLGNLIGNAIDAMADSVKRKLAIDGSVAGGETVIRISDSGPGISPDDQGRIFNAFYSTKPSSGMGLGLTLCKRITAIYKGSLTLDPDARRGATFVVKLPSGKPEGTARHG